jgi:hypothetical protein
MVWSAALADPGHWHADFGERTRRAQASLQIVDASGRAFGAG